MLLKFLLRFFISSSVSISGTLLSSFPPLIFFEAVIKINYWFVNLPAKLIAKTIVKNNNIETTII